MCPLGQRLFRASRSSYRISRPEGAGNTIGLDPWGKVMTQGLKPPSDPGEVQHHPGGDPARAAVGLVDFRA